MSELVIEPGDGWLRGAKRVESPNFDERPVPVSLDLIVVHAISLPPGEFGGPGIEQFFCNRLDPGEHDYYGEICNMKVSCHVLIRRDGSMTQFVPFLGRAWHAGQSEFAGRPACNDYSVGIELEGCDDVAYEPAQYQRLAALIRALRQRYPSLGRAPVVGHEHVSPGRKTDPGPAFDWQRLTDMIGEPS